MSLRYQDTDLRSLKAAYKPLISKELGRSLDSEPETYYGNNGVSREVLARTNDVARLTKALASGAGIKFAANTALAAGLGVSPDELLQIEKARDIGLAPVNRAAALLANAATAGTGYHTGDPFFPYSYLGTSNFFKVGSFFGVGRTVISNDPEAGLNPESKKLKNLYKDSVLLFKTPPYPAGNKIANPGNGLKDDKGDQKVNSSILDNAIVSQRLDAFERNGLDREVVGERGREIKPSDKSFTEFKVEPKTEKLKTAIGDRTDGKTDELKERSENREDQISNVYKVNNGKTASYDYRSKIDALNLLDVTDTDLGDSYDFIKFKMVIKAPGEDNDSYLFFRSYLMDYNDSFDGQWSGVNYIGRAEPLYNYTGFNRQINFNFMIAAGSKDELLPLYNKLNRLVSTTAPSYSSTFMRGVYVQLTIGDLLVDTPGFFTNLTLSWNTSYPWDVVNTPKVPTVLDVSAIFTPVHNFTPEYKQPFLLANV